MIQLLISSVRSPLKLLLIALLTACSPQEGVSDRDSSEKIVEINVSKLSLGSLEIDITDPLDFGITTKNKRGLDKSVLISNNSLEASPLLFDIAGNGFSIKTNRCPEILDPNQRCQLNLTFSARSLYNGTHTTTLLIESGSNSLSVPLVAEVTEQPNPAITGTPNIVIEMAQNFSNSASVPYRRIDFENIGDGDTKDLRFLLPQEYGVRLNRCPNNLSPNQKCHIEVLHKNYRQLPPPVGEAIVRYEYSDILDIDAKKVNLLDSSKETETVQKIAIHTTPPPNTREEYCSGEDIITNTLVSCKDQYGIDVNQLFCPATTTTVYQSPAGEKLTSLSGGSRFDLCAEASSTIISSRVECLSPAETISAELNCCGMNLNKSGSNILANNIADFAKNATSRRCPTTKNHSGLYTVQYSNGTTLTTQLVEYNGGSYSNLNNLCNNGAQDDHMCIVRFKGDTTLSGSITTSHRKKGMVIFVDGNLTINSGANVSMTARGAKGAGANLALVSSYTIPATGANGGQAFRNNCNGQNPAGASVTQGSDGSNGQTGGGAGGGSASYDCNNNAISGRGGNGTSWSGGAGGGSASSRSGGRTAGAGSDTGGRGGCGSGGWDWAVQSGVGNPDADRSNERCTGNTAWENIQEATGTGGLLVLFVNGALTNNGTISANGVGSIQYGTPGGASGGGSVNVFHSGTYSGSGTITANGGQGASWRRAGNGTSRRVQLSF